MKDNLGEKPQKIEEQQADQLSTGNNTATQAADLNDASLDPNAPEVDRKATAPEQEVEESLAALSFSREKFMPGTRGQENFRNFARGTELSEDPESPEIQKFYVSVVNNLRDQYVNEQASRVSDEILKHELLANTKPSQEALELVRPSAIDIARADAERKDFAEAIDEMRSFREAA